MTHLPEIWECIKVNLPKGQWVPLERIYSIVEQNIQLDKEDFEWQSPSSNIPKWKRNVRNVLQYRKKKGEIEWMRILCIGFNSSHEISFGLFIPHQRILTS